ncbi:MAG: PIN/TRAM domain-containing protein, partial [Cyanobacteria bacterium CAN_BIN43]|nr:PIN/TRAM domain-containing protein [Cyanobacteria bacterium CAN_BIN43]
MLDAIIIISFIIAGGGIGFFSVDFLPTSALEQVSSLE